MAVVAERVEVMKVGFDYKLECTIKLYDVDVTAVAVSFIFLIVFHNF